MKNPFERKIAAIVGAAAVATTAGAEVSHPEQPGAPTSAGTSEATAVLPANHENPTLGKKSSDAPEAVVIARESSGSPLDAFEKAMKGDPASVGAIVETASGLYFVTTINGSTVTMNDRNEQETLNPSEVTKVVLRGGHDENTSPEWTEYASRYSTQLGTHLPN